MIGTVETIFAKQAKFKKMLMAEATLRDDSGGVLKVVWFNQPWMTKQIHKGDRVRLAGIVGGRYGVFEMRNPLYEPVEAAGPSTSASSCRDITS